EAEPRGLCVPRQDRRKRLRTAHQLHPVIQGFLETLTIHLSNGDESLNAAKRLGVLAFLLAALIAAVAAPGRAAEPTPAVTHDRDDPWNFFLGSPRPRK